MAKSSKSSSAKRAITKALTGKAKNAHTQVAADGKITLLVKENPYRANSAKAKSFARVKSGMSVEAFLKAGGSKGDLSRMVRFGRIKVA